MTKKSLEIDMIAGSQLRDTQGEMLSVEGADISDLEAGRGRLNDNHGKGFFNSIGAVTGAKKIFKKEDCENDRHRHYWDKVKAPFIYVKGYLYDDEDHPNAKAAAAILRNIHKNDAPLQLKASVEGGVISRGVSDSTLLAKTKIHSVALTFTPANRNTLVEPISLDKSTSNPEEDKRLIASVMHLVKKDVPSFRHIVRDSIAQKIEDNITHISSLAKQMGLIDAPLSVSKDEILQKAMEDRIKINVEKIHAIVTDSEDLDKGLKELGMAAAMGAGLAIGGPQATEAKITKPVVKQKLGALVSRNNDPVPHQAMYKKIAQTSPELAAIGEVESTSGLEHDDHKTVTKKGIDYGHTAGGIWAMMPHHCATIILNDKKLAGKYPELAKEAKNSSTGVNFNHTLFTNTLNRDPQAAADFAVSALAFHKKRIKDQETLFASWLKGVKKAKEFRQENGPNAFKDHDYTKKVMAAYKRIMQSRNLASKPMSKALMAGYGGAGAPTSRTGGAVLQSESPSKSLKYIVCDRCGKEQIHSKYQVKCRHCNDNFSLKKLNDILG